MAKEVESKRIFLRNEDIWFYIFNIALRLFYLHENHIENSKKNQKIEVINKGKNYKNFVANMPVISSSTSPK